MGPTEILVGVAFPLLISIGFGLATAGSTEAEFWLARGCFVLAALDLLGITIWWQYASQTASWKLAIAAAIAVFVVAALPESMRWIDGKGKLALSQREQRVAQEATDLAPIIQALRDSQQSNAAQRQALAVVQQILAQYEQLQDATKAFEARTAIPDVKDRLASAERMLSDLKSVIGHDVQLRRVGNGRILILKLAPNTFRVTFAVPMRVPPKLAFYDLPAGTVANVTALSNIGFTVVFTPPTASVDTFNFTADAALTGG